jgi:trans-aconitate methyltransferase
MSRRDTVWQREDLARTFLEGVRGGIPLAAEQLDVLLRVLAAQPPIRRYADLGCGDGALARAILSRWPQAKGMLLDFSAPMLEQARARLQDHPSSPVFAVADLADPGWIAAVEEHAPLDAVVSGFAIHHLPDERKRALYAEIFDLLAPGGMFLNLEHVASSTAWIESISDDLMVDSLHAFHSQRDSTKTRAQVADEFVHRPDKAANILAPVERQCDWLRQIGFGDVDCYFKVFELALFGGRKPAGKT